MENYKSYEFFMREALRCAKKALDGGEFPVGCVIVYKNKIIASGSREGSALSGANETEHAEILALRQLNRQPVLDSPNDITVFCTLEPCLMCYGAILITGIRRVVYAYEDVMGGGTSCDLTSLPHLYSSCKVTIVPHILRRESLYLFKTYFDNPSNSYLADTYLADYTRCQSL